MDCETLVNTGLNAPVLALFIVGGLGLAIGFVLLLATRRRRSLVFAAVLLVALGSTAVGLVDTAPASAVSVDCATPSPTEALTITQVSTVGDVRPGAPALEIHGTVTNNLDDDTFITAIEVSIVGVTRSPDAALGNCDATDFILLNPLMPVGEPLDASGTVPFSGASLGFNNKPQNQDACKNATIHLLYTAS